MKADDAKKIISTAIDREVEAYTFYRGVADKVKDPALKSLFTELAGEEKKHREFLQGIRDGGEVSIEGNHVPSDDGQAAMYTHFNGDGDGGGLEAMIITFPDASKWTFNAIVTNYQAGDAPYDGKLGFSATLKISGVPNFSTS